MEECCCLSFSLVLICHGVGIKGLNKDNIEDSLMQRTARVSWPKIWWRGIILCILGALALFVSLTQTLLVNHGLYFYIEIGPLNHHVVRTIIWIIFELSFFVGCYLVLRRSINLMDGVALQEHGKYVVFKWAFTAYLVYLFIFYAVIIYFRLGIYDGMATHIHSAIHIVLLHVTCM